MTKKFGRATALFLISLITAGFLMVGCSVSGGGSDGDDGGGEGEAPIGEGSIIYDPSSSHVANYTAFNGSILDFWAQADNDGNITYISDVRSEKPDGREIYIQIDELGRLSYFEDPAGNSLRVNYYMINNTVDITISNSKGETWRGILNLPENIYNSLSIGKASDVSISLQDEDLADMLVDVDTFICQEDIGSVTGVITASACLLSIPADILAAPDPDLAILSCTSKADISSAVSGFVCSDLDEVVQQTEDAANIVTGNLEEDESPIAPPTTGTVTIEGGDVHITLSWDNATDLDLFVTDPFGEEISFLNPSSTSGGQLDLDDSDGYGPENIFWPEGGAPLGQYSVKVVCFSNYGRGASNYLVTVRYGSEIEEYSGTLINNLDSDVVTTFILE
jgi:hypothetical protein